MVIVLKKFPEKVRFFLGIEEHDQVYDVYQPEIRRRIKLSLLHIPQVP
jgi:hypothetical protein